MLLSEIASRLGLTLQGADMEIRGVNTLADAADSRNCPFWRIPSTRRNWTTTKAARGHRRRGPGTGLPVLSDQHANPYLDFARCVQLFAKPQGSLLAA
jgi:UDP-3-O-[3-hydroxymyristoyl] glucosamine N-acyltransferase